MSLLSVFLETLHAWNVSFLPERTSGGHITNNQIKQKKDRGKKRVSRAKSYDAGHAFSSFLHENGRNTLLFYSLPSS